MWSFQLAPLQHNVFIDVEEDEDTMMDHNPFSDHLPCAHDVDVNSDEGSEEVHVRDDYEGICISFIYVFVEGIVFFTM